MNHSSLRLTPQNSPFFKSPTPRSPTKVNKSEELGLQLRKVIGTTTESAHGFDYLSSKRRFSYLAGAAAVLASFDEDLNVTQRFFRAKPSYATGENDIQGQWPGSPSPLATRHRAFGGAREGSVGASPLGQSVRDASDSPTVGKSSSAKERVKALTSVALSPNGKWLAVGETGYKPRILIFSTSEEFGDSPVATISEHTFGVHALAFSHDSRFLASLGTVNDGFLHVWHIDGRIGSATLHASNKCTVAIHAMEWMGSNIITAGLRHVKVWRPEEQTTTEAKPTDASSGSLTPRQRQDNRSSELGSSVLNSRQKVLEGKNSLLGELLDANFVSVSPTSMTSALLCTDAGDVCLLDDSDGKQSITQAAEVGFAITTACIDNALRLNVKGRDGETKLLPANELLETTGTPKANRCRSNNTPTKRSHTMGSMVNAVAFLDDVEVAINSERAISLRRSTEGSHNDDEAGRLELLAHGDAAIGTRAFTSSVYPDVESLSFSAGGSIMLWDHQGVCVNGLQVPIETSDEMYGLLNQLKAVSTFADGSLIAAADRYGTLTVLDVQSKEIVAKQRAHSTEVMDVTTEDSFGASLIATAGRDRTVQLFAWREHALELLQTMDEHAGAVTSVVFAQGGKQLLSCSPDRSVVVREAMLRDEDDPYSVAFVMIRALALKSSPTSMCLTDNPNSILVATTDRSIGRYSTKTGHLSNSFKCSDPEGGEAVTASKVLFSSSLNGTPTVVTVSSSDKSVRLYTEYGSLIARDWGHTEGITDAALVQNRNATDGSRSCPSLVTVAADSTMFIWDTLPSGSRSPSRTDQSASFAEQPTPNDQATLNPPLRKVISYSELQRAKREKSASIDPDPVSPPPASSSPQRLRKKTSRMSVAQPPRLEPAFRSSFADSTSSRRHSLRHRSPSPPSPRTSAIKREATRRPSGLNQLRSKSSENVFSGSTTTTRANGTSSGHSNHNASASLDGTASSSSSGNLTSSTASLTRALRSYRRKLTLQQHNTNAENDALSTEAFRELQEELKVTARALSDRAGPQQKERPRSQPNPQTSSQQQRSQHRSNNRGSTGGAHNDNDINEEDLMSKLLDRASEKIVDMLDGRIKERVEVEFGHRRVGEVVSSAKDGSGVESMGGDGGRAGNNGRTAEVHRESDKMREEDEVLAGAVEVTGTGE